MMFSNKEDNRDYSGKKYLLIIIVLMLIAALGLSIASLFKNEQKPEFNNKPLFEAEENAASKESEEAVIQSYSVEVKPELQTGDKIIGNSEASLKIFVYEDYGDILSAKFNDTLSEILNLKNDNIAIVFRPFISSSKSAENALALECSGENGEWRLMREKIFNFMLNKEKFEVDIDPGQENTYYAEKIGLNTEAFNSCLTNERKSGKIEQLVDVATQNGVKGSPTIFVGEEMILGARPWEDYTDSNGDKIEGLKSLVSRVLENK